LDMSPADTFDPVLTAKKLLRTSRFGALASLQPATGNPFCSLVNIATSVDGSPLLLLSRLAVHTKNIAADSRISLLLGEHGARDPLAAPRASIVGNIFRLDSRVDSHLATAEQLQNARRRYLAANPSAETFVDFADFGFYRIAVDHLHLVAGFGRIVDLSAQSVLTEVSDAAALLEAEAGAVAHMNADHGDTMNLYATALLGADAADWRCIGIDPEGLDMRAGDGSALRLVFPRRVVAPDALRRTLKELADHARGLSR
jgi:heme iron utilization protein